MKISNVIKEQCGFAQIPNSILYDDSLSFKGKGLFAYIYSKPDSWDFSYARIEKETKEGKSAILATLQELETAGYLKREKLSNGKTNYHLYNKSLNSTEPSTENPYQGKSLLGKIGTISNTDSLVILKEQSNTDSSLPSKSLEAENKKSLIQGFMGEFCKVNPNMRGMMGWKIHRESMWSLIQIHGVDKLLEIVRDIPRLPEMVDDVKYLPYVGTPTKLLENFTKIENLIQSHKSKNESKTFKL